MVNLDRCNKTCYTLDYSFGRICVPYKTENVNINVFNVVTRINESKTLTKHISCKCKYKFDGKNETQIKCGITINVDASPKVEEGMCAK